MENSNFLLLGLAAKKGKEKKRHKKKWKENRKRKTTFFFWNRIFCRIDQLQICDGWSRLTADFVDDQDLKKKKNGPNYSLQQIGPSIGRFAESNLQRSQNPFSCQGRKLTQNKI